jgi:hypothetical protein
MDVTQKTKKTLSGHIEIDLSKTELEELVNLRPRLDAQGLLPPTMSTLYDVMQQCLTDLNAK